MGESNGIFNNSPFMPRHAPVTVRPDLKWWSTQLAKQFLGRRIQSRTNKHIKLWDSHFGKRSKSETSFLSAFQMILGPNELIFTSRFPLFEEIYIFTWLKLADLPKKSYWGWCKYRYREVPKATFADAKRVAQQFLDACPIDVIRRFINRSWRFLSAYRLGLTGRAAMWAVRKQKGHVVPILNTVVFSAIAITVVKVTNGFIPRPYTFGRLYRVAACIQAIVNAFLIASMELTIRRNNGLVDGRSSDWGFGQILILLLGIDPILAAFEVVTRKLSRIGRTSRVVWRFLGKNADPWDGLYQASECLACVLEFLDRSPDSAESSAIKHSLRAARAHLAAANKTIRSSNAQMERSTEDYVVTVTPTVSIEAAAIEVDRFYERVSIACDLRFPDIQDAKTALIARGYLEAAKDALSATKGALDASRVAGQW